MQQLLTRMGDIRTGNQNSLKEIVELGTRSKEISKVTPWIMASKRLPCGQAAGKFERGRIILSARQGGVWVEAGYSINLKTQLTSLDTQQPKIRLHGRRK